MTLSLEFTGLLVYLMVFVRLAGMIALNPLLSRSGVPAVARMGIVLFLTLMIAPMQPLEPVVSMNDVEYVLAVLRELLLGAVYGYTFIFFYYLLYFVGDTMDTDFGIAMAKTFDPAANVQTSFSGRLLTLLFGFYVFATGAHLTLIHMYAQSFALIPLGVNGLSTDIWSFMIALFSSVFKLGLRLVAPFMVAEFILQVSMGILMKFIPQITIFVINFQLRILLGLLMLFLFAPFIGQFIDNYITVLFDNLADAAKLLSNTAASGAG